MKLMLLYIMNNQDYFIERYYRSLSSILNDKKQINKLSAFYIIIILTK